MHYGFDLIPMGKNGADDRIRTGDLLFTKQLLYQLSYIGKTNLGQKSPQIGVSRVEPDFAGISHIATLAAWVRECS